MCRLGANDNLFSIDNTQFSILEKFLILYFSLPVFFNFVIQLQEHKGEVIKNTSN